MVQQKFEMFCIFMMLIAVTHSALIARRSSGEEDVDEDKKYGWNTDKGDDTDDKSIGENPESSQPDSGTDDYPDADYPDESNRENEIDGAHNDDGFQGGPFDAEEDLDESVGGDQDPEVPDEEDEFHGDGELVDEMHNVPVDAGFGKRPELFGNDDIIYPFFSLKQVREYFHELEKALERVFTQTVDEAKLLNGTYANTTEEEIDINGKKYVVQKSIIQGGDNDSAIYVETLSSKSKDDGRQGINGMEIRNETEGNITTSR